MKKDMFPSVKSSTIICIFFILSFILIHSPIFLISFSMFLFIILCGAYRSKKFNYKIFYSAYLVVLLVQSLVLVYTSMNMALFKDSTDYVMFLIFIVFFVASILYFIQLYRHADRSQIITW